MKMLTQVEVSRTAFRAIPSNEWKSPYGYTNPGRDKNEMCPYCYNEDTDIIRDPAYLEPFKEWYGDKVNKFTAMSCWCCSGVWSFYTLKPKG